MNLIEKINNELIDKHFNEFEKQRYIYLRACQIFSFDSRWHFAEIFDDYKLLNYIATKKIDLEHINNDRLVICYNFSMYVLDKLLKELTNSDTKIHLGTHCFLMSNINDVIWKLDATMGDLAAVKIGLKTEGFKTENMNYRKYLEEVDTEIGYSYVERKEYLDLINAESITERIHKIGKLLENSKSNRYYSDAHFFLV